MTNEKKGPSPDELPSEKGQDDGAVPGVYITPDDPSLPPSERSTTTGETKEDREFRQKMEEREKPQDEGETDNEDEDEDGNQRKGRR